MRRARGRDGPWIGMFLLPFLLLYGGFTVWPLIATMLYSLFDWDGIGPLENFVGLDNYRAVAEDPLFWSALWNTLIFVVLSTAIKLPLSFVLAVLLTRKWLWFKRFFRTVFFAPLIVPSALFGLIFPYLLNPSSGALNDALLGLGIIDEPLDLLGHGDTALLMIILVSVWQILGQYMIFWMAALQQVPEDLYEVSALDGAGSIRQHWSITLPIIRPIGVVITLLAVVNALHVFGVVVTLTGGGPGQSTYTTSYFIYAMAFQEAPFRYGYASATALLFSVIAIVFVASQAVLVRRAQRQRKEYGL